MQIPLTLGFSLSDFRVQGNERNPGHEKTTYWSIGIGECLRHVVENQ